MNVTFKKIPGEDKRNTLTELFSRYTRTAIIFSRNERYKECIAIIPTDNTQETDKRHWVWLNGEDGAYTDGEARPIAEIIQTIIVGEWNHQPDATITISMQNA